MLGNALYASVLLLRTFKLPRLRHVSLNARRHRLVILWHITL